MVRNTQNLQKWLSCDVITVITFREGFKERAFRIRRFKKILGILDIIKCDYCDYIFEGWKWRALS